MCLSDIQEEALNWLKYMSLELSKDPLIKDTNCLVTGNR